MKSSVHFVMSMLGIVFVAACGAADEDPDFVGDVGPAEESTKAHVELRQVDPNALQVEDKSCVLADEAQMSIDPTQDYKPPPSDLGKKCWATCTVVASAPNVYCPASIGGYGNTTFLGGCNKACGKARADAASKLPPGCFIHNCNFTGC